jgi:PIN domain nuclease of toxin-antitoxin system
LLIDTHVFVWGTVQPDLISQHALTALAEGASLIIADRWFPAYGAPVLW